MRERERDEGKKCNVKIKGKKEKRSIKSWISYLCGKKINDQFEREMNQDVNRSRKLFWKEASKVNGGKLQ